MQRAGVHLLFNNSSWGVVGLSEIFRVLPKLFFAYYKIIKFLEKEKPSILILIDYPGFNLRIAKVAKKIGIKVIYYIPPMVWGRKGKREEKVAKLVDHLITFFPQDYEIYKKAVAKITLVEHPLLKIVKPKISQEDIKEKFSLKDKYPIIGILPGSRVQEVKTLLPVMLSSAEIISKKYPSAKFLLPVASDYLRKNIEKISKNYNIDLEIFDNFTYEVMSASDVIIVCSGTATLEAALLSVPMVIVYKVSKITEFAAKKVLEKDTIGIPNIILQNKIIPELLQEDVNPEKISKTVLNILEDEKIKKEMKDNLAKIKELLKGEDAVSTTADIILKEVNLN